MLNPRDQRYAERLRELVTEAQRLVKCEKPSSSGSYIQGDDAVAVQAWIAKFENIFGRLFGPQSSQVRHLRQLMPNGPRQISHDYQLEALTGLLIGALDDLEMGFLANRELLIAGELFDTVLEQAKHLLRTGYKDVAAVLGRVVLEDALRRIAPTEGVDPTQKPAKINEDLKAKDRYSQPQWRQVQTWLDIGNAAAHGKFADYSDSDVAALLDGLGGFLANHLRA
jgi:hypothetical protein